MAWLVGAIAVISLVAASPILSGLDGVTSQTRCAEPEPMVEVSAVDSARPGPLASGNPPVFIGTSPSAVVFVSPGEPKIIFVRVSDMDGDNVNVRWNFGDGTPDVVNMTDPASATQTVYVEHTWNPVIEQGVGGVYISYTLDIMIDDGNGNYAYRTSTVACYIPENYGPQSDIEIQSLAFVNDTVDITAKANDTEGEPLTWTFVFNDTVSDFLTLVYYTPATEPATWQWNNITHTFDHEGYYNVTLYVSDALGINQTGLHNTSDRATVVVAYNRAPCNTNIANLPEHPSVSGSDDYVDVSFYIEVLDIDGDVVTAAWDFGDGSAPETNSTSGGSVVYQLSQIHRFIGPGEFNVTVTISDGRPGNEVIEYLVVTIISTNIPPSVVLFSHLAFGPPWDPFVFSGTEVWYEATLIDAEMDDLELVWDFGDGSPNVHVNLTDYVDGNASCAVNHVYADAGVYAIVILYTDNQIGLFNHTREYYISVRVEADNVLPVADAGEDQLVQSPCNVYFDGSGSVDDWAIANYSWSFVYNGTLVELWGVSPSFEFWTLGTYVVLLNVTDYAGNCNTSQVTVEVVEVIPEYPVTLPAAVLLVLVPVLHYIRRRKWSQ
ncbi:MAG: hypothetical protein A3K60_06105 [Euryarchaeota archaeon RBG_19FT_COMBO_56_21]|nr:MAG: hypothetical protein A3K60_06105 [Euryarchaeota archaeon RBG_19FT_COMBO_56_21]